MHMKEIIWAGALSVIFWYVVDGISPQSSLPLKLFIAGVLVELTEEYVAG